jgi:hypothetical protein
MQSFLIKTSMLFMMLLISANSQAASAEEAVVSSCSSYISSQVIPEDSVCYEYINGFIDGAILTDSAIIENITKEKEEFSSFFKRAYKTRVGRTRDQVPVTYYAKFCLPEDMSRKAVIEELIHELDEQVIGKQSFRNTLYDTMKRVYACED